MLSELLKWHNAVICEVVAMARIDGHLRLSKLRAAQDTSDGGAGRRRRSTSVCWTAGAFSTQHMAPLVIPALDLGFHLLVHGFQVLAGNIEAVNQDGGDPCPPRIQEARACKAFQKTTFFWLLS